VTPHDAPPASTLGRREALLVRPPLRGERDYVHVADIVAAIETTLGAWSDLALRLTAPAAGAIEIVPTTPSAPVAQGVQAERVCGQLRHGGAQPRHYTLLLRPDLPATERVFPDEDAMSDDARITGQRIDAPAATGFTFVERLTALIVELLLDSDPHDYWRVAELVLTERPRDDAAIGFEIVSCVGRRFWKGVAFADGRPIGHVVLVLAPRPPGAGAAQ